MKKAAVFALGLIGAAVPALAQQSEVLFSHKQWQVELVAGDDGTLACTARVSVGSGESFAVWSMPDGTLQLQFYSPVWEFGEQGTADLQVQIDRQSPWNLTNAELYRNSVLFNLPGDGTGERFIREVSQGGQLFLRAKDGAHVQGYSLSGSSASITALKECGSVLRNQASKPANPSNPFATTPAQPAQPKNPFN